MPKLMKPKIGGLLPGAWMRRAKKAEAKVRHLERVVRRMRETTERNKP